MRPNSQRAKQAIILLYICAGMSVLSAISEYMQYNFITDFLNGESITMEDAQMNDIRQVIISIASMVAYIISAVFFIMWFRRAYYNQEQLFKQHLSATNGWCAGAWFIPIYSLYRPFQLMKEIYENADDFLEKRKLENKHPNWMSIIGWWWGLWIFNNIVSNIITRMSISNEDPEQIANLSFASTFVELISIAAAILAVKTIKMYTDFELVLIEHGEETVQPIVPKNDELLDTF